MNLEGSCIRVAVLLLGLLLVATPRAINGEFVLMVNLINYTNPSGLCAECGGTTLDNVTTADQLVPVCCDESTSTSNCDNTGNARCDTRFRWTIRPFGASLETRPASIPNAENPPYFFTDCALSPTSCPFSEMSATFSQGPTDFLGVTGNPLDISKPDFTIWTGQIQFYIEPVDSGLPNIIDSLLVNLDSLQLGGNFTEEMMFTGFHNISTMTMSFRVECSPGFCGPDCTTTPTNNPLVAECQANGSVTCVNSKRDPSLPVPCSDCLYNLNSNTNCSRCLQFNYDPDNNCMTCLSNYDIATNCSMCTNRRYDPVNNCQSCVDSNFNPLDDCTSCLLDFYDPQTNCTQCLPDWDTTSGCTQCLLPNRDPATNCSLCLQPDRFTDTNCIVCALPERDPATLCETCLTTNYDPSTNCTQCLLGWNLTSDCTQCIANHDLGNNCSSCLSGYDSDRDCAVCEDGRDIATRCTSCLSGFTGEDCRPRSVLSVALVGGIAGGVGGALLFVIIILVFVVCGLMCQVRRRGTLKVTVTDGPSRNAYNLEEVGTGTGSSTEHKFQNPIYGPGLDSKTGTGMSEDHMFPNGLYESSKLGKQDTYSQLRHPSVSPPSHTVKTGTNEFVNEPIYNSPDFPEDIHHQRNVTPVSCNPSERQLSFSKERTPQKESYSRLLRQPTDTSITLQPVPPTPFELGAVVTDLHIDDQPVYDEAILPSTHSLSIAKPPTPSKSKSGYEKIKDDLKGYDNLNAYPSPDAVYSELDEPRADFPPSIQSTLPPNETLYDDTVLSKEHTPQPIPNHDYAETADLPAPGSATKPHPYDYIDNPLDNSLNKPVYTNTLPGKLTTTALSHYDLGN